MTLHTESKSFVTKQFNNEDEWKSEWKIKNSDFEDAEWYLFGRFIFVVYK